MKINNTTKYTTYLAFLISSICSISPATANKMGPSMNTPAPSDAPPSVVLNMQAKQPGDYNFQASVNMPPEPIPTQPYTGGKLGMITPVMLNGLTYVDLQTGMVIPSYTGPTRTPRTSRRLPPEPMPEPLPEPFPEPMPPPPPPQDHGRIMSVGRDPDYPGAVLITYQDGTVERVFPPSSK